VTIGTNQNSLTYACGLVFCHAKAPIKNTAALAHKLGDQAKSVGPERHSLAYEVLESFDDISGDLTEHRQRFLPAGTPVRELVIDPTQLNACWNALTAIRNSSEFPMRQLYRLCAAWKRAEDYRQAETRLRKACKDAAIDVDQVTKAFGNPVAWLHLLQMLPYLFAPPQPTPAGQSTTSTEVQS
jgi:hypothetical protein